MQRIAIVDRKDMNAEQARVHDAAKAAGSVVGGPYYVYIRNPALFEAAQHLRTTLAKSPLSPRERQIVNMTIARHWNAAYPWAVQARSSLTMGIARPVVDAINARQTPDLPDARERTCYTVAMDMLHKGLSDAAYAAAEKTLGQDDLIALVATVGSFTMTCLTTAAFQIEAPADIPVPLQP